MSIRWIRNVLVDGEKTTLEILLGQLEISDKCYIRVNSGNEQWFTPLGENRDDILSQGIQLLKKQFANKDLSQPSGQSFQWD